MSYESSISLKVSKLCGDSAEKEKSFLIKAIISTYSSARNATNVEPDKLKVYEILACTHQPMLLANIFSFVHDAQLAEDIAQESLIIAYQKLTHLREPEGFGPWLRRIAGSQVLVTLRAIPGNFF